MTQIQNLSHSKGTFPHLGKQTVSLQNAEYLSKVLNVLFERLAEDENIIQIDDNIFMHMFTEQVVHDSLESASLLRPKHMTFNR